MSWKIWTLFAVTETILCLTPGPAVLLVVAQGLSRGRIAALWSSIGILAGNAFYFLISATGLGAILLASYSLFSLIKWIGAGYLVWLGIVTIFSRSSVASAPRANALAVSSARMTFNGFILQASNPKALIFFAALLPQFIDPRASVAIQVAMLAATSITIEFFVLLAYGTAAGRLTHLATRPRFAQATNTAAGAMLIAAGAGMATIRRAN
jgi:homoserine/homoserine lactone efflux protein